MAPSSVVQELSNLMGYVRFRRVESCKIVFLGTLPIHLLRHVCCWTCRLEDVFVSVADLNDFCLALNCDDDCEVVQGYDTTIQQTVFKAYCVCNVGYTRVRVLDGFRCDSQ